MSSSRKKGGLVVVQSVELDTIASNPYKSKEGEAASAELFLFGPLRRRALSLGMVARGRRVKKEGS